MMEETFWKWGNFSSMGYILTIVILYIPVFYSIHRRIRILEDTVREQGDQIIRLSQQLRDGH